MFEGETFLNSRLNNHIKDVKDPNAVPPDEHFAAPGHDFNNNATFAFIEMLSNTKQVAIKTLKKPEGFLDKIFLQYEVWYKSEHTNNCKVVTSTFSFIDMS